MIPTHVETNEASTAQLVTTIKAAYKQIATEINGATNFGVANRRAILAQVDKILANLGEDVNAFLIKEIPQYYKTGGKQAVDQLISAGADIPLDYGFNRVHMEAVAALVSDASRSFADALAGVKRNATLLLGKQIKAEITQRIATGMIQGSAVKQAAEQIKSVLASEGIDSFVDSAGRSWSLDRYAEMLYRTKIVEARNMGMVNKIVENGFDLAQVSIHGSLHRACAVWEGKIVSLTGNDPNYPTLEDAIATGLFHPNCEHAVNVLTPDLSNKTMAYDSQNGSYVAGGGLDLRNQSLDLEG